MTAADFLVTHRDTDLAQAAQDQGAQAHSFVGAHDIDLLANVRWHDDVTRLPERGPLLIVANEFFDALPVRQFAAGGDGWRGRAVRR